MKRFDETRRTGLLLPLFSLRARGGLGVGEIPDIVPLARWAAGAGFSVFQILPAYEVSEGETSPYAASTAFALDAVYLSLDACEDFAAAGGRAGFSDEQRREAEALAAAPAVEWERVRRLKAPHLRRAFEHFRDHEHSSNSERARAFATFCEANRAWLDDYALFAVLRERHRTWWRDWPAPLRDREPDAIARARDEHADAILQRRWTQWQLDVQWKEARRQSEALGVRLMGDLPFMCSIDSADVWSRPGDFRLDMRVGTPPDAFSAEGQDWGLPLYNWEGMAKDDFFWMRARAARCAELYPLYRVDHVIGLYRTYYRCGSDSSVCGFSPEKEEDQVKLGEALITMLSESAEVIAEDLGMVPDFLRPSLTRLGVPGYKVLRWEKEHDGSFRDPAAWDALSVATNGTHDITTNAEWWETLEAAEKQKLLELPGLAHLQVDQPFDDEVRDSLLRVVWEAPSALALVPFQDAFGTRERVNVPGTVAATNWTYRTAMDLDALAADRAAAERLRRMTEEAGRRAPAAG